MSTEFRNNHYVPVWYQKRFIPSDQPNKELFYLDLKPEGFTDPRGVFHPQDRSRHLGPNYCFAEKDLYTTYFGPDPSTDIEQHFFGSIDQNGRTGVDYFADFAHPSADNDAFDGVMLYMGTQKLRTPKGLGWLRSHVTPPDREAILNALMRFRRLYGAIWMESVWQIADASQTETKFIVSDHPVTSYNRACGPNSRLCRGYDDPDPRLVATHTIFPLSLDKVLILSNRSWVRNPYQQELAVRPHPILDRPAFFNFQNIQIMRSLDESEVRQINFIIKSRAHRYIGAAKKEWLYPEANLAESQWKTFGDGLLLMPDPRSVYIGGEVIMGFADGSTLAYDEYGRGPDHPEYKKESKSGSEKNSLYRFQGEFARRFGPYKRGRSSLGGELEKERTSDEYHQHLLEQEVRYRRRPRRNAY